MTRCCSFEAVFVLFWVQLRETPPPDIPFRLDHERRLRVATDEREPAAPQVRRPTCRTPLKKNKNENTLRESESFLFFVIRKNPPKKQEDERLRLQGRQAGLELQGLQGHESPWTQERAALQQEVRLFRRNTVIFYMKLRSILMRRRLGCKDQEEAEPPEVWSRVA